MKRLLLCLVLAGCTSDPEPEPAGPPDLLVVVLDTTSPLALEAGMPNAAAFVESGLRWERSVAPSNSTVETVAALFQDRTTRSRDFAPGADSTSVTTLAEKLGSAGYSSVLASANEVLDHELFARGFDSVSIHPRGAETDRADADAVDAFLAAWDELPSPRFGWLQVLAGHDYRARPEGVELPDDSEDLDDAWQWHLTDAGGTDALLPPVLALAGENTLVALTADHGELFPDRGPFMVGAPFSFGHGEGNSPLEIEVPFALAGLGLEAELRSGAVSTLDLHPTLLAAAGLEASVDLRAAAGRLPGAALCNLLNLGVSEGAGNMTVLVEDDGSQIVRTHPPDSLPVDQRPPLLATWPATGVGYQSNWEELELDALDTARTRFLFDDALPECKGFQDLCDEYPELEAIGYIECD